MARVAVLVLVVVALGVPGAGAATLPPPVPPPVPWSVPPTAAAVWTPPVAGPVGRRFEPPATPYGPGHLGVDFVVPSGTLVRAAGPGVVVFAGPVAGADHVVVAHAGGLRTSYSFLAGVAVHRGETVGPGRVVGWSGGRGEEHRGALHFGLRVGDRYVDPLVLFRATLADVVHLAPTRGPPPR